MYSFELLNQSLYALSFYIKKDKIKERFQNHMSQVALLTMRAKI